MSNPTRVLDLKVLYAEHPAPSQPSEHLALIVLGRLLTEGEPLDRSRWTFLFIGSVEELHQQFTAHACRQFDQRHWLAADGRASTGGAFLRRLNTAIDHMAPYGAQELLRRNIRNLSWSEEELNASEVADPTLTKYEWFFGSTRFAITLRTDYGADLALAVSLRAKGQAKALKQSKLRFGIPMIEKEPPAALQQSVA